ncbi:hypothetical protein HN935_02890 [archaeon]|nr:hypothetical protein [Candidatus Jacksonbacteria bacterium]MBT7102435.1 hypothetical protein [archaeon]
MTNDRKILTSFTIVSLQQGIKEENADGDNPFNEDISLAIAEKAAPFLAEMLTGWSSHLVSALASTSPKKGREASVPSDKEMLESIGEIVPEALVASNCLPTPNAATALASVIVKALFRDNTMEALIGATCFPPAEKPDDVSTES